MRLGNKIAGLEILGEVTESQLQLLSADALEFFLALQREFNPRRVELLEQRKLRQQAIDRGEMPDIPVGDKTGARGRLACGAGDGRLPESARGDHWSSRSQDGD